MFLKKRKRESVRSYNIRIYHGSDKQFEYPRVDVNKGLCDFGPGFYATEDYKRAYERAVETATENKSEKAYVMCFDFHDELVPTGSLKILRFTQNADWLKFVKANREGLETEDFDIAIGPSADGFIEKIFARIKDSDRISSEELSQSIKELADNHWGTQYCFRNQDLVDNYISYKRVVEIDPKMSYPAPEVITEYVIGAFAEAHDMSISDARVFLDKFDGVSFVQENYKAFAYKMSIDMVKTLRNYIRRCGGVCPPIVRKIDD